MNYQDIFRKLSPFLEGQIFVGFSGGADSLALLLSTVEVCPKNTQICAVHFNHNIRPESVDEARFCREFCQQYHIVFKLIELNVLAVQCGNESVESVARRCRLEAWQKLVAKYPKHVVLLGHHADDRRENFFLRLARGSNSSGATGLRAYAKINGVTFFRPLLPYRRSQIEEFLHSKNIEEWCNDSSNNDQKYRRNFVRHKLIPEFIESMPFADAGLFRAIDAIECDAFFLENLAQNTYEELAKDNFNFSSWEKIDLALFPRVLRLFTGVIADRALTMQLFQAFHEHKTELRKFSVNANLQLYIQDSRVWLKETTIECVKDVVWNFREESSIEFDKGIFKVDFDAQIEDFAPDKAYFDLDLMPKELIICMPKDGDRMIPFGKKTAVKLKKLRCDRNINSIDSPPILCAENQVIWFPLVRHSSFANASSNSRIISITYLKIF